MSPSQVLFDQLFIQSSEKLGYDTYDSLPRDDTPYPFVYLGNVQQIDDTKKDAVFGDVYLTIHVWSNTPKKRGDVSMLMLQIKNICRALYSTENFTWHFIRANQQILPDNTTKTPLLHGVIETEFKFS